MPAARAKGKPLPWYVMLPTAVAVASLPRKDTVAPMSCSNTRTSVPPAVRTTQPPPNALPPEQVLSSVLAQTTIAALRFTASLRARLRAVTRSFTRVVRALFFRNTARFGAAMAARTPAITSVMINSMMVKPR